MPTNVGQVFNLPIYLSRQVSNLPHMQPTRPMRTLILMRHAHSDAGHPQLPDHQRPLTDRGRFDALRMAQWIEEEELIPQTILASTALRARETVEALQAAWTDPPQAHFSDALYLAPSDVILRCIRGDALDSGRVLVVAHNPGLQELICHLSGRALPITPAAVAAFRIETDEWSTLSPRSPATLIGFSRPETVDD